MGRHDTRRPRGRLGPRPQDDGYEPWDGTGDPGDPGYAKRNQITWNPGHPVMG